MVCLRDGRGSYTIEGEGVNTKVVYSFPTDMQRRMRSHHWFSSFSLSLSFLCLSIPSLSLSSLTLFSRQHNELNTLGG